MADLVTTLNNAIATVLERDRASLNYETSRIKSVHLELDVSHGGVTDGRLWLERRAGVLPRVSPATKGT